MAAARRVPPAGLGSTSRSRSMAASRNRKPSDRTTLGLTVGVLKFSSTPRPGFHTWMLARAEAKARPPSTAGHEPLPWHADWPEKFPTCGRFAVPAQCGLKNTATASPFNPSIRPGINQKEEIQPRQTGKKNKGQKTWQSLRAIGMDLAQCPYASLAPWGVAMTIPRSRPPRPCLTLRQSALSSGITPQAPTRPEPHSADQSSDYSGHRLGADLWRHPDTY
ncbi:hypothetical protein B0I35DRAFT_224031 [Stachybotrys elegans]|uniref:Uncharacterized protein n=1 Tax=Stachybotrys elegans TaxID=80388 RepID=A0A8K0WRV9_9HYPO|nr:hypothetical protein B0I35DRAFT_224031 [Stachybotrys elegans]